MTGNKQREGFSLVELMIVMSMLSVVLGLVGFAMISVQGRYLSQQSLIDAQNNAKAALGMLLRLVRVAGNNPQFITFEPIDPDPDGDTQMNTIRLRADWNPGDGILDDPYEDMIFSTSSGVLYVKQPSDTNPVEFVDSIESLAFTYLDSDGATISDPVASKDSIAYVDIELRTQVPDVPAMVFRSSAVVQSRR